MLYLTIFPYWPFCSPDLNIALHYIIFCARCFPGVMLPLRAFKSVLTREKLLTGPLINMIFHKKVES